MQLRYPLVYDHLAYDPVVPPKSGTLTQSANVMRCASTNANKISAAALLTDGTPQFIKNIAGNDFSSISDLITGPGRIDAGRSILQGKALNTVVRGAGQIPVRTGIAVAQNGAGTWYSIGDTVVSRGTDTAAGKLIGGTVGAASDVKLAYNAATSNPSIREIVRARGRPERAPRLSLFVALNEDQVVFVRVTFDNRFHDRHTIASSAFIRLPLASCCMGTGVPLQQPLKTKEVSVLGSCRVTTENKGFLFSRYRYASLRLRQGA